MIMGYTSLGTEINGAVSAGPDAKVHIFVEAVAGEKFSEPDLLKQGSVPTGNPTHDVLNLVVLAIRRVSWGTSVAGWGHESR